MRNCVPTSALSFRKDSISNAFPLEEEPLRLCADAYLRNYAVYHHGVASIPDPLGVYRRHGENRWHDKMRFERTDIEKTILNLVNRKLIEEHCAPIPENPNAVEQSFLESLDTHPNAKYLIFGTDSLAQKLRSHLSKKGGQIVGYVHPDSGHKPSTLDSLPVHSAEELQTIRPSIDRIIIGTRFVESACNTLFECGLSPDLDFLIPLDIEGRNDPVPKSASPIQDSVVLFGASECGKHAVGYLSKQYSIQCFSDNDPAKWGQRIENIPIISPQELSKFCHLPVIITSSYFKEIALQLNRLGFDEIWKSDPQGNLSKHSFLPQRPESHHDSSAADAQSHNRGTAVNTLTSNSPFRHLTPHKTQDNRTLTIIQGTRRWAIQPTLDVEYWARRGNIPYRNVASSSIHTLDWSNTYAIYAPDGLYSSYISELPKNLPLILDCPANVSDTDLSIYQDRNIAVRRAFGGDSLSIPKTQVPYFHFCSLKPSKEPKDTVIVDLHNWLPISCQFAFLSILSDLNEAWPMLSQKLGFPIRFYFTSGVSPALYSHTHKTMVDKLESLSTNHILIQDSIRFRGLQNIADNTVSPQSDMDDHNSMFSRGLFMITDNGDIADQDVIKCISTNTGVWIVPRSSIHPIKRIGSTMPDALAFFDPDFPDFNSRIQRMLIEPKNLHSIFNIKGTNYDFSDYLNAVYDKIWNYLWNWATSGSKSDLLTQTINDSKSPDWWKRLSWM